jgi:hypothetical protein
VAGLPQTPHLVRAVRKIQERIRITKLQEQALGFLAVRR